MNTEIETIIRIALEEFGKVISKNKAASVEIEEIEEQPSGNYLVTLGYWIKDTKPEPDPGTLAAKMSGLQSLTGDLLNPWRRKYKRVEIDPKKGKVVAIRMYEPALGVS
ncbi:MAG: hypothetical protein K9N23_09260 [Akkermansiaceae bacterium]|nr:hypothetical protein [Akkermansiaceae bacterium]